MILLDNKYHRWYDAIVAQGDDTADYVEKHHILPRALGGTNEKTNLIRVTARKHFLLHWLLTKFTHGYALHKMQYAFGAMTMFKGKRCLSSWQFEKARHIKKQAFSKYWENPEAREKQSLLISKYCEENPEARREAQVERYKDPKAREIQSAGLSKRYEDPKEREKTRVASVKYYAENSQACVDMGDSVRRYYDENPEAHEERSISAKRIWARRKGEIPEYRTQEQIQRSMRNKAAQERRRNKKACQNV